MWQPPLLEKLPFEFGGHEDWDGWLLANCADNIDFVSEHTYAYPGLAFDAEKQHFVDAHDPLPMQKRAGRPTVLAKPLRRGRSTWKRCQT
jgi:hypothetical protein